MRNFLTKYHQTTRSHWAMGSACSTKGKAFCVVCFARLLMDSSVETVPQSLGQQYVWSVWCGCGINQPQSAGLSSRIASFLFIGGLGQWKESARYLEKVIRFIDVVDVLETLEYMMASSISRSAPVLCLSWNWLSSSVFGVGSFSLDLGRLRRNN